MKIAALTDIGSCRQENQDNYCARQLVDGTGWGLVCDGMGGANGGRVASTLATQTMLRYFDHSLRTIENGEEKAFMPTAPYMKKRPLIQKCSVWAPRGYVLYSAATWRILYTQGIPARTCGMAEQSAS